MTRLKEKFNAEIVPALKKEFGYANTASVPKITKVVINSGVGKYIKDDKMVEAIEKGISMIAGQKAVRTKAKKSIAGFKTREGMDVGIKVTLRGERMYHFIDRLISIALPRTRDFHGIDRKNIDQGGNLTLGMKEDIVFPETSHEKAGQIFGFQITAVTNSSKKEGEHLFALMGFPLKKEEEKKDKKDRK